MTPGEQAYTGYLERAGGRSLVNGDKLPKFSDLNEEVRDAWAAAEAAVGGNEGHRELPGFGAATVCRFGSQTHQHTALRFVWHHILPQAAGGKTEAENLASLCDNCHYSTHAALWALAQGTTIPQGATDGQIALAEQGYAAAVKAGTVDKIPKESAS
jgi:hypothetical protein